MFATVRRIADELSATGIDYEIHHLQRYLANQHRAGIIHLRDIANAIASLNR
jgi:hypothetical protein